MKASYSYIAIALCLVVVVLLGKADVSMAVTCNPTELSPCAGAITSSTPPIHNMLHQDQATEALPLPVSQQPQPQEVCQHPKCQESC
ncbi:unnamed protein product [Prunus armeniaca]|uniref:Bifunctional inhibitor/plant lipid transfer protein/seed storage helical domain-containing protein n=1 Tax=Prunus armeniaca TaxID=36596 RepID=A0A6J5XCR7_PRUAR|nr:unnamed protein product [Prunus armeniaca]